MVFISENANNEPCFFDGDIDAVAKAVIGGVHGLLTYFIPILKNILPAWFDTQTMRAKYFSELV